MKLDSFVTLGRSGLKVSPLCLGAMTFGDGTGPNADEARSRAIFDMYVDRGGNFIDTADGYTAGISEQLVGKFINDTKSRDKIVLATKFTFNQSPGNPNSGGNGRKNIHRAVEASLKRLGTDYIDLYWLHAWDTMTPADEVMSTIDALVRDGKVRYFGMSDIPAWYAARAHTLAELRGWEKISAFQLEYSLIERSIEREHIPLAQELGIGLCPWSPLASGFLSGKYRRAAQDGEVRRLDLMPAGTPFARFDTPRNREVVEVLVQVAEQIGRPPAEVALKWLIDRPGVTSTILGASRPDQLASNLASLEVEIPAELRARLDEASAIEPGNPYRFFEPFIQGMMRGGTDVRKWSAE
ncbi:MAG TPA: aldo/keto reductase [Alphaproteobacteria bacterium]|jgi:aryl-alcohol dehydrogenase-like predicted oxidoreductase|nr:aldo/keto reductase [Alphaproteobacteria bacterium]